MTWFCFPGAFLFWALKYLLGLFFICSRVLKQIQGSVCNLDGLIGLLERWSMCFLICF